MDFFFFFFGGGGGGGGGAKAMLPPPPPLKLLGAVPGPLFLRLCNLFLYLDF